MKLRSEASVTEAQTMTAESLSLARWYDSEPAVRRLWGIRTTQGIRVIVVIEPSHDSDDVYPSWLANARAWARELGLHTGSSVQLELIQESQINRTAPDVADGIIIADLFWRDATLDEPSDVV